MNDRRTDPSADAASEQRRPPVSAVEAADLEDRYAQMLALAAELDGAGDELRAWAEAGAAILTEADVAESAPLSPRTWSVAEDELTAAVSGPSGLLRRAADLDADATVLRATVHTYRWIDDLQAAAYATLGSIAGRAIGYLAPEVALGGSIVAAGLIETDSLDRDGVASYLGELAESNPELMEHVTTGGGLIESLQVRGLLTCGALAGEEAPGVRRAGLRATGVPPMPGGFSAALRDAAVALPGEDRPVAASASEPGSPPHGLGEMIERLVALAEPVAVHPVTEDRAIVYLPGPEASSGRGRHLRLVAGDLTGYSDDVVRHLEQALIDSPVERVLLVGVGAGGVAAVDIAARTHAAFTVEEVVTASAPSATVPATPPGLPVLALEDRSNPVALLGSLINASSSDRLTVVYAPELAAEEYSPGAGAIAGARLADLAEHDALRATFERWRARGYLSP